MEETNINTSEVETTSPELTWLEKVGDTIYMVGIIVVVIIAVIVSIIIFRKKKR